MGRRISNKTDIVKLTQAERQNAIRLQQRINNECSHFFRQHGIRANNALGYDIDVTTLTTVLKTVSKQKFFTIPFAQYVPVRVGEGAWGQFLTGYRSFEGAGKFSTGIIDTGGDNTRLASATAGIDAITTPVFNWAKSVGWSIIELYMAARAQNWDLIDAKETARKRNWDLGIQEVAFLGLEGQNSADGNGKCFGLLNQPGILATSDVINEPISGMNDNEFNTFVTKLIESYRKRSRRTAYPTHLIMPESDFNGLASQMSVTYPMRTKISLLEEAFKLITMNQNFKILPVAYADADFHPNTPGIQGKNVYALYNFDDQAIRMDIPVDYTNTMQNTIDGFSFQSVGYGQFTGVTVYRPLELQYFLTTPA